MTSAQLDQATLQARQYYEQLAQQTAPPQQPQNPIAPAVSQFFQQPQSIVPPQASPQIQQQITLLMQSNDQILQMLTGISQAITTQSSQSTIHGQWIDHLIKRLDTTDQRLDKALTAANLAIVSILLTATITIGFALWPKSAKAATIPPTHSIDSSWESS